MKYLLLLVVIGVVFLLLQKSKRKPPPDAARGKPPGAATMLSCAHCGLHVPASEAVLDAVGRPFCGEAHRLAGPR